MKKHPAIAVVEFSEIPCGMSATDAMLKKAPIAFVKCGTISRGRYLTLVGGSTASVDESLREGLAQGGPSVLDHILLADVHPRVYEAILGRRKPGNSSGFTSRDARFISFAIMSSCWSFENDAQRSGESDACCVTGAARPRR